MPKCSPFPRDYYSDCYCYDYDYCYAAVFPWMPLPGVLLRGSARGRIEYVNKTKTRQGHTRGYPGPVLGAKWKYFSFRTHLFVRSLLLFCFITLLLSPASFTCPFPFWWKYLKVKVYTAFVILARMNKRYSQRKALPIRSRSRETPQSIFCCCCSAPFLFVLLDQILTCYV